MKVTNMISNSGNAVANQFIIQGATIILKTDKDHASHLTGMMFQSYSSNIVFISYAGEVFLDSHDWNYSKTTSKYRNQFLRETTKETQKKIDSGEYILTNLN